MQTGGVATPATFKTAICDNLGWLQGDCQTNLYVDVQTFDTFQEAAAYKGPVDTAGKFSTTGFEFEMGAANTIELVRVYYKWPFITPLVGKAMARLDDGSALLMSTIVFRNEPYA
jgi:hypothetical protein